MQHVDKALQLLWDDQLFIKCSKWFFGVSEIECLGQLVGKDRVRVDPKKIETMQDWLCPKTLKGLHGFLSLTCNYIKFIKNYGKISTPLTTLLKKNNFLWNKAKVKAFSNLKQAMCNTPVLVVPDFSKTFVLECDAFGKGLGIVLMQ